MSDNASSSNNAHAGTPPNPATPKPRNPVERAIVWGLIGLLVVVMLFEAKQKYAYEPSLTRIKTAFKDDNNANYKLSEVRQMLSGSIKETEIPSQSKINRVLELQWTSLFKDYRVRLLIEKDVEDPVVISFSTPDPIVDAEPTVASGSTPATTSGSGPGGAHGSVPSMGAMGMGGGPGGPGGGGPGGGGGGGQRGRGMLGMAQRPEVTAELGLTAEQLQKLTDAQGKARAGFMSLMGVAEDKRAETILAMQADAEKAVREAVDEKQFARLQQLLWRDTGLAALVRDDAAAAISLTDEQRATLKPIFEARQSGQRELRDATPEVRAEKRKGWEEQIQKVLTEEQVQKWDVALGAPAPAAASESAEPARERPKRTDAPEGDNAAAAPEKSS